MKSKIIFWIVILVVVALVVVLFPPCALLWLYENYYSSMQICLPDFMNYLSSICTGLGTILLSALALYFSMQKEKISIGRSKSVIRAFVELSCIGFKKNSQGNSFRYYIPNRNDFENHLQILINSNVLNKTKADLCRSIFNYVRSVKKMQKSELKDVYAKFGGKDNITKNIEEVLKKL